MNYGGEQDRKFNSLPQSSSNAAAARDQVRNQGRRGTVTVTPPDQMKLKLIAGLDATIVDEDHGGSFSAGKPTSQLEVNRGDLGVYDDENDYDLIDDECGDERQELQHIPQSLLLKRTFWT